MKNWVFALSMLALLASTSAQAASEVIEGRAQCAYFEDGQAGCMLDFDADGLFLSGTFRNRQKANELLGMVGDLVEQSRGNRCGFTADVEVRVSGLKVDYIEGEGESAEMTLDSVVSNSGLKLNRNPEEMDLGYGECRAK